jgi:hypothetical protein
MIIIANSLVLSDQDEPLDTPLIGWHTLVTASNVSADTENASFPVENLANPSTILKWAAGDDSEQYLTIATALSDDIDYVAIARHNLGTAQVMLSVEGYTELAGSPLAPDWQELISETILANDDPAIFRFEVGQFLGIRLRFQQTTSPGTPVSIAVLNVGKLLVMERGVDIVEFTPFPFGRTTEVITGRSEAGDFLGRIVTGSTLESSAQFSHLTPYWFRTDMQPFLEASPTTPFFYAWSPDDYPTEVGFAWLTGDAKPQLNPNTGRFGLTLQMAGIEQ